MKKIIFILTVILLSNGMCFAQDSISKVIPNTNQVTKQDSALRSTNAAPTVHLQQISIPQPALEETKRSTSGLMLFLLITVIVLVIALSAFVFLNWKKQRDVIIDTIIDNNNYGEGHRLQHWLDYKVVKAIENALQSGLKTEIQELEKKVEDLRNRLTKVEENSAEKLVQPSTSIRSHISDNNSRVKETQSAQPKKLYALNIIDGVFNKVSEQVSGTPIFELTLSSSNSASFTVSKGAFATILAAPEYLEGCDKQTLSDNPTNLQIVEGKASLQDDGKWKITQKANVKLV